MKTSKNNPPDEARNGSSDRSLTQEQCAGLMREVAQNRDRTSFEVLFDAFAPKVKSFLIRRGLDTPSAEDLMQDVLLSVWTKAGLYDTSRGSLQAWIFTIARNALIDRARRRKPDLSIDMIEWDPVDESESSEQRLLREERASRLKVAMQSISSDQLAVLHLAYQDELSQSEIATKLGLPLGTVKSRLRLAYTHLRSSLG